MTKTLRLSGPQPVAALAAIAQAIGEGRSVKGRLSCREVGGEPGVFEAGATYRVGGGIRTLTLER